MHPYQAKPFGALPEQTTQVSPPAVRIPHLRLPYLLKPTLAVKPELLSFHITSGKQETRTRSSSHPAFFSLHRTRRTTLYSYGIIRYLKVNTNISIFFPVFHTHTSKRFQLFVEHYRNPSAFSSFFRCPEMRTVTSWKCLQFREAIPKYKGNKFCIAAYLSVLINKAV